MSKIKKEIIEATLSVLKEKKLEKTSISEILKKLDKSAGNVYYYFGNKNEIYKEMTEYSVIEVAEELCKVKKNKNIQTYLFNLTERLINFLEEREEILFLLLNIRGSSYLDEKLDSKEFLKVFEKVLLKVELREKLELRLQMFIGAIYEVLYMKRVMNKKKMTKKEIYGICEFFWGDVLEKKMV